MGYNDTNMPVEDIRKTRLKKLEAIKKAGLEPYPIQTKRTNTIAEVLMSFDKLFKSGEELVLTGRIVALREHGGSTFLHFKDGTGQFQAYFKRDGLGEMGYKFFLENFDIGDFIEIRGLLFTTKKGEKTIEARDYKMLAKSLLPLPEKWHGLQDVEERYRKRYLDLNFNPEVREKFILRSKIISSLRHFLDQEGFLEVETPVLQSLYGGATARPFKTHHNALDIDLYLRIAPELYLKRLLVGGFEKVYEIGQVFRNEGVDKAHNPDFTMLEFYQAYADYKDLMHLTEKMFEFLLQEVFGKLEITVEGKTVNFRPPWKRVEYFDLLKKEAGADYAAMNVKGLGERAEKLVVVAEKSDDKAAVADKIFKKYCQPKLWEPTFVIHHPREGKPLAKTSEKDPQKAANFQLVVAGWELINAYSELNDPIEQKAKFQEQEKIFKQGLEEAQRMDEDYIEALEYGMPPAAGWGLGVDRLVALLTNSGSLREVILFPLMKFKQ